MLMKVKVEIDVDVDDETLEDKWDWGDNPRLMQMGASVLTSIRTAMGHHHVKRWRISYGAKPLRERGRRDDV